MVQIAFNNGGHHDFLFRSEEGQEGLNKIVRRLRLQGARMTSRQDNVTDIYNHIFVSSSPRLAALDRQKKPRYPPRIIVPQKIDAYVASVFANDDGTEGAEYVYQEWGEESSDGNVDGGDGNVDGGDGNE